MRQGHGPDRVRFFPLFNCFMCGECEERVYYRNLKDAMIPKAPTDYDENGSTPEVVLSEVMIRAHGITSGAVQDDEQRELFNTDA